MTWSISKMKWFQWFGRQNPCHNLPEIQGSHLTKQTALRLMYHIYQIYQYHYITKYESANYQYPDQDVSKIDLFIQVANSQVFSDKLGATNKNY